ncbi:response regulator transcription factor [Beijerinckia mobilis]|uniref:response regulator transcription factor n=1 Tax=Beijerinckia mobilis TaxID=231434 RepID=UPI0005500188|nr:response regulator transcription factor [Beijerinckia mobilis]
MKSNNRIRVVLADDHPVVLAGIRALLQAVPDIELIGEVADGAEALTLIETQKPDVAILDISMPGLNGIELSRRLSETCPTVKIIALTVHEDRAYVKPLIQAGAQGYLLKRSAAEDLIRAVNAVAAGGMYLDPAIVSNALSGGELSSVTPTPDVTLSPREEDVLKAIAQGFSNKEIAASLQLSTKTIETYKARAADKLNLKSRAEIVRYGVAKGWLASGEEK